VRKKNPVFADKERRESDWRKEKPKRRHLQWKRMRGCSASASLIQRGGGGKSKPARPPRIGKKRRGSAGGSDPGRLIASGSVKRLSPGLVTWERSKQDGPLSYPERETWRPAERGSVGGDSVVQKETGRNSDRTKKKSHRRIFEGRRRGSDCVAKYWGGKNTEVLHQQLEKREKPPPTSQKKES